MTLPEIMTRNMADILGDIRGRAPFYTPRWSLEEDGDLGLALAETFAYFSDIFMKRLNQAPTRHFLSFLELINASLLPAQSAVTPLTFVLSEGAGENVPIPEATEVSAPGSDGKPIPFQTEKTFVVTPSKPVSLFTVIPGRDALFEHTTALGGAGSTRLFQGENLQEHSLYVGDKNLLNLRTGARIRLHIDPSGESLLGMLTKEASVTWSYATEVITKSDGKEIRRTEWIPLKAGLEKTDKGNTLLLLCKDGDHGIDEIEVKGIKSRWIRGTLTGEGAITLLQTIRIRRLTISTGPEETGVVLSDTRPVRKVQGIGDTFGKRLADVGVDTVDELLRLCTDEVTKLLSCRKKRAEAILEAAKKSFFDRTDLESAGLSIEIKGFSPDLLFFNDVPCPSDSQGTDVIYPFGKKPQIYDTFYIASGEAFSKTGYRVEITFLVIPGSPDDPSTGSPRLSWEYWDGEGWGALNLASAVTWTSAGGSAAGSASTASAEVSKVTIPFMPRVEKTRVNGKENCWIRVRLVSGDYGKEFRIAGREVSQGTYNPPAIKAIGIDYVKETGDPPAYVVTKNNRNLVETEAPFSPFAALADTLPSVYLAFDKPLAGGPFSLFLAVEEDEEFPPDSCPKIRWQILEEGGKWTDLDVLDETRGFTRNGLIQFVVSLPMKGVKLFGSQGDLYWLRAVIVDNWPEAYEARPLSPVNLIDMEGQKTGTFEGRLPRKPIRLYNPGLKSALSALALPVMTGLFANTTWARQCRTIGDEILGSSSGEPRQKFLLMNLPVIEAEIWVNEATSLVEGDRRSLTEGTAAVREKRDDQGNLVEFWVRWKEQEDFVDSAPGDRHYRLEKSTGEVLFGDGVSGAIPPIGANSIKATYTTGGGKKGNLPGGAIAKLQSAIPFVDRVWNPLPADGGADSEAIDALVKRAPAVLKHRHRATALEDYEWLAREASRKVARVKVLPNFNARGTFETGWVTVVIVPHDSGTRPIPSPELRSLVETYLQKVVPNVASLRIIPPSYVRIRVTATLFTDMIDRVPEIEYAARNRLQAFLHPLTGGPSGEGWAFGVVPCVSDVYALLEGIDYVDHVSDAFLALELENGQTVTITDALDGIAIPPYGLPYSGDHTITARWQERKES